MGLIDRLAYTAETIKKKREEQEIIKALKNKELRDASIPVINALVKKYNVDVKYLDTDAYIFVIEDGKERGTYIPYGTPEVKIDLLIDTFIHDYASASKHKMKRKISATMTSAANIGHEEDGGNNFWDANISLKSYNTSLNRRH